MPTREENRLRAIERARRRRVGRADLVSKRTEWFIKEVSDKVAFTLHQRVRLATSFLQNQVVKNISKPVVKDIVTRPDGSQATIVTERSKKGEYPRADTTQLMKTLIADVRRVSKNITDGFIGTPLDYGLILELRLDRSFLRRTLNEQRRKVTQILTGPIV